MTLKTKTPFFSTSVRPQFWVALGLALVVAGGFFLGYAVAK